MRSPLLFLLLLTPQAATAQPVFVNVDVDPEEITVGDPVRVKLTLVWDGETPAETPQFPEWSDKTWGQAELSELGEVRTVEGSAGRMIYSQALTVTAFEIGNIELPSRFVTILLADETVQVPTQQGVGFVVRSVISEDGPPGGDRGGGHGDPEDGDLEDLAFLAPRPAAALRELPGDRRFWWTAASLLALCGLAALDMKRRLDRIAAAELTAASSVLLTPFEELREALGEIDPADGSEAAHTALSLALRRFLARTLGINAMQSTTSEIRRVLGRSSLTGALTRSTVVLLGDCDQVKYAHLDVEATDVADRLALTGRLASDIESELRPPQPGDSPLPLGEEPGVSAP